MKRKGNSQQSVKKPRARAALLQRPVFERERAETALQEAESRLRAVLSNAPITIFATDSDGVFTLSEGKGLERTGLKPGENVGVSAFDLYGSFSFVEATGRVTTGNEVIRRALAGETVTALTELRGVCFENRISPLLDKDGKVVGIIGVATDITERRRVEEALRESEERYRNLVELSPAAIFVHSHGALLFVNAAGATMLGAAHPGELTGKSLPDFIHPDHRHEMEMRAEQIEQAGKPRHQEETQFVAANGRTLYAEVSSAPITYLGQAARLAMVRDISKRRQGEKESAERSRLLEAIFANTLTSIVLLDRDFNFIRANEAYARACAREVSDFPGHNYFELYPSAAQAIFEDVVRTRKPFQTYARPFAFPDHPDWGVSYWDWTLVPILDSAGEVGFLVLTLNDVSERAKAEAERQKLASAVEQTDVGVMIVNRQGVIEFVNAALERIVGYSRQDLLGQTPSALQSGVHSEEFYAGLWRTILDGESFHSVFTDKTNKDKYVHVDQTISPIRNAQGDIICFVSVWKDISKQVQAEEESARLYEQVRLSRERMQVLSKQLIEAHEAERRSVARELHDEIGQALTSIKINLQGAQRPSGETGPGSHLEESIAIVERALQQVRDLSLDLRPSLLDDLGLVPALRWYADRQTQRAGIRMQFIADPPETRPSAEIETACFRVAQEALTNIVRHAQAREVLIELRSRPTEGLKLLVRDDGVGFDVEAARERAVRGASLGLLGMEERALLVGGQIKIESTPGKGSGVSAHFPLASDSSLDRRTTTRK
jgi:PAS domain S-box-containing protein